MTTHLPPDAPSADVRTKPVRRPRRRPRAAAAAVAAALLVSLSAAAPALAAAPDRTAAAGQKTHRPRGTLLSVAPLDHRTRAQVAGFVADVPKVAHWFARLD